MEIKLELKDTHPFNKHFQFCIGSGHAPLALRHDYLEQLKMIHDHLHINQVRFHGIFNDDMNVYRRLSDIFPLPGAERFEDICFDRIKEVYDNVLSCGMKPFVELGFMPKHLAKNLDQHILFYYGGYSSMPKDDESWVSFIKKFIQFLIEQYGKEEIETWKFEVWNEPDLIVFFGGSKEDYFHLYEITAKAIKEVDNLIQVGGPATSGSLWIKEFVQFVKENHIPCDFITTHQYAGDPIAKLDEQELDNKEDSNPFSNPFLLQNVEDGHILDGLREIFVDKSESTLMQNDTIIINSHAIKDDACGLPIYYTEWNENATFSASTNDTKKVPAFLVMTALKCEDSMTGSSVWCFSDIFEEMHMFNEEFHGGFGLLTHHGIKKPSYYGMEMLCNVGDLRYNIKDTYGDITLAAFKNENIDEILLTRQNMKNLDLEEEQITIKINDLGYNKVLCKRIDDNHGNPLKAYLNLNKRYGLTTKEINDIKISSELKEEELSFTKENGELMIQVSLKVNDVYLLKLLK